MFGAIDDGVGIEMITKFRPGRGWVAIIEDELSTETSSGIVFRASKNPEYFTGIVVAIGLPPITMIGKPVFADYNEGDRVLVVCPPDHRQHVTKYTLVDQLQVVLVIDKDTVVT